MACSALKNLHYSSNFFRISSACIRHSHKFTKPVILKRSDFGAINTSLVSRVELKTYNYSTLLKNEQQEEEKERERQAQEKMKEEDEKKRESAWRTVKYTFWGFGGTFGILGAWCIYELGRPSIDENGNEVIDEFSNLPVLQQYLTRLWSQVSYYQRLIQEPSRDKLLPDPVSHPYIQPPYTLVLEMTDVLVHPDWTYQTGWRFKKRPGVDHFLEQVASPLFEIVIYTAENGMTAFPILDALDPNQHIMYRLVRDATHFVDGHHVKDLSRLNRDLAKVIVVDWNPDSVKLHRSNSLIIPRWRGNDDDFTLVDLAALLRTMAAAGVDDVRGTLEYYSQYDNPIDAFRENRRRLAEKLEEELRLEQEKPAALRGSWTPSFLKKKLQ